MPIVSRGANTAPLLSGAPLYVRDERFTHNFDEQHTITSGPYRGLLSQRSCEHTRLQVLLSSKRRILLIAFLLCARASLIKQPHPFTHLYRPKCPHDFIRFGSDREKLSYVAERWDSVSAIER